MRRARSCFLVAALALCSAAVPDSATPQQVIWPMFFRVGPGTSYTAVQELSRGTQVDVLGCTDGWCRVQVGRVIGYVEQANLGTIAPPAAASTASDQCFDARRTGYRTGQEFRYCPR